MIIVRLRRRRSWMRRRMRRRWRRRRYRSRSWRWRWPTVASALTKAVDLPTSQRMLDHLHFSFISLFVCCSFPFIYLDVPSFNLCSFLWLNPFIYLDVPSFNLCSLLWLNPFDFLCPFLVYFSHRYPSSLNVSKQARFRQLIVIHLV